MGYHLWQEAMWKAVAGSQKHYVRCAYLVAGSVALVTFAASMGVVASVVESYQKQQRAGRIVEKVFADWSTNLAEDDDNES